MSLPTLHEVLQETTPLLPACLPHAQDSFDEPTAPAAICAAAALPPQDGMPQSPLGGMEAFTPPLSEYRERGERLPVLFKVRPGFEIIPGHHPAPRRRPPPGGIAGAQFKQ